VNKESVLDSAAEYVYQELEKLGGDPLKLPPATQPVAILYHVQGIIDNGGFRYLFENDFPHSPPYSVFIAAYREIGAQDAAIKLEQAVAFFPFSDPHLHQEERLEFMDSLDVSHALFALGDEVCGDERVWHLMEQYVESHPEAFSVRIH
jgi:hypothetical protein